MKQLIFYTGLVPPGLFLDRVRLPPPAASRSLPQVGEITGVGRFNANTSYLRENAYLRDASGCRWRP